MGEPNGSAANEGDHFSGPAGALSDGSGTVALIDQFRNDPRTTVLDLYAPSGAKSGTYTNSAVKVTEQLEGFILSHTSGLVDARGEVAAIDGHGNVIAATGLLNEIFDIAIDPLGGVTAISSPKEGRLQNRRDVVSFDEHVKERWRVQLPTTDRVRVFATDRAGNTLVLVDGSSRYGPGISGGIWIDHSGHASEEFKAADVQAEALYPRVGDGLFLAGGAAGKWVAQFDPFGAATPAPDWLSSRPAGTTLHMARNGRAYAVIAPPSIARGPCSTSVDVVAPSGKSCGTAVFPSPEIQEFGSPSCASGIVVGYDGTAIQRTQSIFASGVSANFSVPHRWWTGYFR